jgi:SEC-C motif-containing protein
LARKEVPLPHCACGSSIPYADCCQPLIEGTLYAGDALALMRSRYVAYTQQREAYLLATWHASTRPASLEFGQGLSQKWLGLTVLRHQADTPAAGRAIVEFVARYKVGGRAQRLHEISRFVDEGGRWYYVDGDVSLADR